MNQINIERVVSILSEKFGMIFRGYSYSDNFEIRPADIEYGEGFIIRIKFEWRSLSVELIPDNFSAALLRTMGSSDIAKKEIFKMYAIKCSTKYNSLKMEINGVDIDPLEPTQWIESWNQLYIKLLKVPIIKEELTKIQYENAIIDISVDLLGLILSLLPLEETDIEEGIVGLPEGALTQILVNRYERSLFNRQMCITFQGFICKVCNINFESLYGSLGKEFIHVHHIVPVSQIGPDYEINPKTDLVPVCPNCHAMIHKRNPPYLVEELKSIISSNTTIGRVF
jgi:5-methylcytosine-specific restriction protein A